MALSGFVPGRHHTRSWHCACAPVDSSCLPFVMMDCVLIQEIEEALGLPIYLESPGKMQSGNNNRSLLPHLGQNTLVHRYIVYTPKFIDKTKNLI